MIRGSFWDRGEGGDKYEEVSSETAARGVELSGSRRPGGEPGTSGGMVFSRSESLPSSELVSAVVLRSVNMSNSPSWSPPDGTPCRGHVLHVQTSGGSIMIRRGSMRGGKWGLRRWRGWRGNDKDEMVGVGKLGCREQFKSCPGYKGRLMMCAQKSRGRTNRYIRREEHRGDSIHNKP